MVVVDIQAAMQRLAPVRPVFHSEADFKHALAWALQEGSPTLRVQLEYRPFPDKRAYLTGRPRSRSSSSAGRDGFG